jgi:hypothetical protein
LTVQCGECWKLFPNTFTIGQEFSWEAMMRFRKSLTSTINLNSESLVRDSLLPPTPWSTIQSFCWLCHDGFLLHYRVMGHPAYLQALCIRSLFLHRVYTPINQVTFILTLCDCCQRCCMMIAFAIGSSECAVQPTFWSADKLPPPLQVHFQGNISRCTG